MIRLSAWMAWTAVFVTGAGGCAVKPLLDNPLLVRPDPTVAVDNPVYVPQGPHAYSGVFEKVLDIVDDYFEIAYSNRYDGRIETYPRIAPGLEQLWKPGSPDSYQRLEATLQTMRHRCFVLLQPADDGGYFIQVIVFKELEDLERPVRSTAGAAAFRGDNTVDRQFEVIDPAVIDTKWLPKGRDCRLEEVLLQRIKKCM